MVDTRFASAPVHRSLLQRNLLGGIPQAGLVLVFILSVVFIYGLRLYLAAVPIAILYLVMRSLTKKDQWMIDVVMENISQKDVILP